MEMTRDWSLWQCHLCSSTMEENDERKQKGKPMEDMNVNNTLVDDGDDVLNKNNTTLRGVPFCEKRVI